MTVGRVELRSWGGSIPACDLFLTPEAAGESVVSLYVTEFGSTEDSAREAMQRRLQSPLSVAYAEHFGDSLDARAFGLYMLRRRSLRDDGFVTEMELLASLHPMADAARRLRHAIAKQEQGRRLIESALPIGRHSEVHQFRQVLEELCTLPDRLEAAGWEAKAGPGPMPRGSADEATAHTFVRGWHLCIGGVVSKATRSRFMTAARELLPLSGVDVGRDPEGRIGRMIDRYNRNASDPLPRAVRTPGGALIRENEGNSTLPRRQPKNRA